MRPPRYNPLPFDRSVVENRLEHIAAAPEDLETFFAWPYNRYGPRNSLICQLDAWAVAMREEVPTMNGFSGIIPEEHRLFHIDANADPQLYEYYATDWILRHQIVGNVGVLHLESGQWEFYQSPLGDAGGVAFYPRNKALFGGTSRAESPLDHLQPFLRQGWAAPDPERIWAIGGQSELEMRISPPPPGHELVLKLELKAYAPPQHRPQRLRTLINEHLVAERSWFKPISTDTIFLPFPAEWVGTDGLVRITFECPDAISPAELEASSDSRRLGIALYMLEIFAQPEDR